jgi:CRISPR-associated protein Cas2
MPLLGSKVNRPSPHQIKEWDGFLPASLRRHFRAARGGTLPFMARTLYLAAYDVSNPRRLVRICRYLKRWRVAGQKSVPEIWVTPAELNTIRADLGELLDPGTDRLQLIALDPRMTPHCLGQAATFGPKHFSIT